MSRFTVTDEQGKEFVYGFDNPLSQYFLSQGRKEFLGPLSKVYGDNYTMIDQLRKHGLWNKLPREHRDAVASDLPFPNHRKNPDET